MGTRYAARFQCVDVSAFMWFIQIAWWTLWAPRDSRVKNKRPNARRRVKHLITASWCGGRTVDYVKGIVNLPLLSPFIKMQISSTSWFRFHWKLKLSFPHSNCAMATMGPFIGLVGNMWKLLQNDGQNWLKSFRVYVQSSNPINLNIY